MRIQPGYSKDTVRIQQGYSRGTVRVQQGYSGVKLVPVGVQLWWVVVVGGFIEKA